MFRMFRSLHGSMTGALLATVPLVTAVSVPVHAQRPLDAMPSSTSAVAANSLATTASAAATTRVTYVGTNVSIDELLSSVSKQAGLGLVVDRTSVPLDKRVSVTLRNVALEQALRTLSSVIALDLQLAPNGSAIMVARPATSVKAQQATIIGKIVSSKTKRPVVGATITIDDATKGVVTGEDGTFRLSVGPGEHVIYVRAIGFTRQMRRVTVPEGQTLALDVQLEPGTSVLDEVIVTGTVVATERKAIPNPITVITAKDIEQRGVTQIEQLFRGTVPGVFVPDLGLKKYSSGQPMGYSTLGNMVTSQVYVRGASGTSGQANPLKTYIDGVEILDPSYIGTIDPKSIERIEIVTGPQASTVYGSGAMGGVMQIFTKKGSGQRATDLMLSLKYGMLENNISSGMTPTHTDALTVSGGTGPDFSYTGTLSYNYTGQWQPKLFAYDYGASLGATYTQGIMTASGSAATRAGRNGTSIDYDISSPLTQSFINSGEFNPTNLAQGLSQRISTSGSQTLSLNLDVRPSSLLQTHLTVGRSYTNFDLIPPRPQYAYPADSLFERSSSAGQRTTVSANVTLAPPRVGILSSTWTIGADGNRGDQVTISACTASKTATSYLPCTTYSWLQSTVSRSIDNNSVGGFGRVQFGLFDRLYLTLGLRAERNPAYGDEHKIDWTPTNGLAYTMDLGDMTVKLLGSYGRATRAPAPSYRLVQYTTNTNVSPSVYVTQLAAPELRPEYSHGPQYGIEMYYGNLASLTVTHYEQQITDLIRSVLADTIEVDNLLYGGTSRIYQYQYQNLDKVRQFGWEGTGSLNFGALTLKGTYSWTDSRARRLLNGQYIPVATFKNLPTHTGNVSVSYASGATSLALFMDYIGSAPKTDNNNWSNIQRWSSRITTYVDSYLTPQTYGTRPGYIRSTLNASRRLTEWASATLDITNLGNSYSTEAYLLQPTLGRATSIGLTLRSPRSR